MHNIPLGYRLVKNGEKILPSDKCNWHLTNDIDLWDSLEKYTDLHGKIYSNSQYSYFIRKKELIKLTEESKNKIINIIKESRAFNEDSALKFESDEDIQICYKLVEEKLISQSPIDYFSFFISSKNS